MRSNWALHITDSNWITKSTGNVKPFNGLACRNTYLMRHTIITHHFTYVKNSFWNTLHWRHNDHDGVSNHQPHACLFNRFIRRRSKKRSKLRVTGLCAVNSPHKGPVTRKKFPFDDVIMYPCCPIALFHSRYETTKPYLKGIFDIVRVLLARAINHDNVIKRKNFPRYLSFERAATSHRWIPLTKASDAEELWCSLICAWKNRLSKQSRRRWFETPLPSLWRHCNVKAFIYMMTSSNGNIFRVTSPLCGEFTGPGEFPTQRPVTRSFDVFFDLRPNKRLSKQWRGWWFETLSRPFWRHRNENVITNAWPNFNVGPV